jgi:hypothetical protein
MSVKLTPGVNFTNISCAAFFVGKFCTKLFCAYILVLNFFGARKLTQKMLFKCWWNWLQVVLRRRSTACKIFVFIIITFLSHTQMRLEMLLSLQGPAYGKFLRFSRIQNWKNSFEFWDYRMILQRNLILYSFIIFMMSTIDGSF